MRSKGLSALAGLGVLFLGTTADAAILWDYSPATTTPPGISSFLTNISSSQNYLESVVFVQAVTITGMEIYSDLLLGSIGQEADVKVFDDAAGAPGTMLFKLNEVIDAIDSQGTAGWAYAITRKHVSFASPLVLPAGTYWFGMSGTTADIGQSGVYDVQNDGMWLLIGDTPQISLVHTGDMAFRLEGLAASVPEPMSIALFGTGLLGISLRRRRRPT